MCVRCDYKSLSFVCHSPLPPLSLHYISRETQSVFHLFRYHARTLLSFQHTRACSSYPSHPPWLPEEKPFPLFSMYSQHTKGTYDPYLEPPIPIKAYIPLESDPEVFTQLLHNLGAPSLEFHDVFSIDDPDLMAIIPRPVLALLLVFPTSETYEKQKSAEEAARSAYEGFGPDEDVIWFKQTIHNACGFYGILHAISNGPARDYIGASRSII